MDVLRRLRAIAALAFLLLLAAGNKTAIAAFMAVVWIRAGMIEAQLNRSLEALFASLGIS